MRGSHTLLARGPAGRSLPGGFTLVEVLMALLLLAGVAPALLMLGTRTRAMLHASAMHRELLGLAAQVTDSLRLHGTPGTGERRAAGGTVTWSAVEGGGVVVEALLDPGPGRPGLERVRVYQARLGAWYQSEGEP